MAYAAAYVAESGAVQRAVDAKASQGLYTAYGVALSWSASTAKRLQSLGVLREQPLAEARWLRTDPPF